MKKILIFTLVASMAMLVGACSKTVDVAVTEIKVNPTEKDLKVGETVTLAATVLPENATEKTVKWISDNPTVASVEEATGKVVALRLGEAKITAIVGTKGAICNIRVVTTPVTSVTLNKTTTSLDVGGTEKLTATVAPSNATDTEKVITWSSNAPTVATVSSNGTITAVATGTATITATAKSGAKATCVVTVKAIPVTGVTIANKNSTDPAIVDNKFSLNLVSGTTVTRALAATVAPATATVKTVTWTSSDATIAAVSDTGVVTAVKAGTATITATSNDGNKTVKGTVEVTVVSVPVTSLTIIAQGDAGKTPVTAFALTMGATVTKDLDVVVAPETASDKDVVWSSLGTAVATVTAAGVVTAVSAGTATIVVTSPSSGVSTSVDVTVNPAP